MHPGHHRFSGQIVISGESVGGGGEREISVEKFFSFFFACGGGGGMGNYEAHDGSGDAGGGGGGGKQEHVYGRSGAFCSMSTLRLMRWSRLRGAWSCSKARGGYVLTTACCTRDRQQTAAAPLAHSRHKDLTAEPC